MQFFLINRANDCICLDGGYKMDCYSLNDEYNYDGELGASYSKEKTIFKVWSPKAEKVVLNFYSEGIGNNLIEKNLMRLQDKGVWSFSKKGNLAGIFYTYEVTINGQTNETQDIYSKAVGINGYRSMVVNLLETNPDDWDNDKRPYIKNQTDAIIYELHFRDISMDENSGIKVKGKFLSLTETGTKNLYGEATGLDHIKELGINAVHILPSFDFGSVDESKINSNEYNWGYDPKNYLVPEGSYSTNPYSGTARIKEMKQMIKAFHNESIAVIMDCVFSHTYEYEHSSFNNLVPNYYYRQDKYGKVIANSQCRNDTASERFMFRKYMIDAVTYWAKEYHVDGFRFDLMGLHDIYTMNAIRRDLDKISPSILMYGEGWNLGDEITISDDEKATKVNARKLNSRIAFFNDDMRDGVRGNVFDEKAGGFVNYNAKWLKDDGKTPYSIAELKEQVKFGIVGAVEHDGVDYSKIPYRPKPWASEPTQTVNYVSCHDNNTIWDKINLTNPDKIKHEKIKMDEMAAFIVLTSQGIPFIQSGQEMLGTKPKLNGGGFASNSFNSSDLVNRIDWWRKHNYKKVVEYYKGLIKLRKEHPAFRMSSKTEIQKNIRFFDTKDSVIGYFILNNANGDKWREIAVIINASNQDEEVNLKKSEWMVVVKEEKAGIDMLDIVHEDSVLVKEKTSMVLVSLKD